MERPKICVVGACNLDLISYVPRLPSMGETLHGNRFQMGFGGKGANQAVMAAKLGGEVTMVSKLGQGRIRGEYAEKFQILGGQHATRSFYGSGFFRGCSHRR